ncbi:xanthine dehydrogenase family protein molybdopterin-binding subunit, partial [Bradyrhizobium sp.]|uniref:xanthine dehydrogenase family protein molybdopterin-binding subunit n=1 Tax=Bradyrhizobium sp. TaxID=376 RepID=UPI00391D6BC0
MTAPLTPLDRPNSYIGRSVPRPNAKRLLAGRGRYVTDIRLPRMLHAAFLRSPHAHARIISIDADAARALAGVHLIATGADLARICTPWTGTLDHFKGMTSEPQLPLPLDRVVWAGQAVVAVVADSRALAEDALELISVDYEELPAVVDLDEARQPGTPRANPASQSNICFRTQLDSGGVDEVFAAAAHVIEQQFSFGRHTPVTLEPRAIVADYEPDSGMLTVHHATQTPYQFQDLYSRHYNIPEARVRVIAPDIGGSFGMKLHVYHEDMAVVGLSMMLGRPVKYVADRIESFVSDIHARDHRVQARMAIDADGKILAMDVHDATAIGAFSTYPRTSVVEGNQVIRLIGAPYGFTSYRAALEVVFQNKVQTSQYRAVGHPIACAVTERMVDIAASRAGLDPLAMRDRNVIADDAYPLVSPTGYKFEALSHQACLRRLREIMDYDALRGEQAELRRRGVNRGIGIATFVEITNPSPAFYGVGGARISSQDGATISLTPTGEVRCAISVTEQGQGTEAIIGQIVADQLGLAQEHVKVITGDTEVTPHGGATWACRGAGIGGETALQAARRLKANILAIAALVLQEQAAALDIVDGQVVSAASRQPRLDVAEIARIAYFRSDTLPPGTQAQLTVSHHFAPQGYPFAFTNGIQGCSLEVDVDTGFVKLLKHYVVGEREGIALRREVVADGQLRLRPRWQRVGAEI